VDPEGNETRALFDLVDLDAKEVLEIGCGDGRLTRRFEDRVAHVTAIDPFADAIERARARMSGGSRGRVTFQDVSFERFVATAEPATFDVAILSWSLC